MVCHVAAFYHKDTHLHQIYAMCINFSNKIANKFVNKTKEKKGIVGHVCPAQESKT